jgi:transposase
LLLTNRKEKEKQVIKLAEEGKTTREISKEVHISSKDIGKIIRKETGDDDKEAAEKDNEKEKEKQKRLKFILHPTPKPFKCSKINYHLQM